MNTLELLGRVDNFGYHLIRIHASLLWQSSIVMFAALIINFFLRNRDAVIRHRIWVSVIYAIPLIPVLSWVIFSIIPVQSQIEILPVYNTIQRAEYLKSGNNEKSETNGIDDISENAVTGYEMEKGNPGSSLQGCQTTGLNDDKGTNISSPPFPFAIGLLIYGTGISLFLMIVMYGKFRIKWWLLNGRIVTDEHVIDIFRRAGGLLGLRKDFVLIESQHVDVPLTVGTINPVIILPNDLINRISDKDIIAVALHEISHLHRCDSLTLTILSIIRAVLFYNPLIWYASSQVSSLSEHVCDDEVIRSTGEPLAYAKMLARLAEHLPNRSFQIELTAGILYSKGFFLQRINKILSTRREHIQKISKMAFAGILSVLSVSLLVAIVFPLGAKALESSDNEELMLSFFESRMAISQNKSDVLEDMLWNKPELVKIQDERGYSLVHYAALNTNILRILIDNGADIDAQDREGNTLLHLVAQWGEKRRVGNSVKSDVQGLIQLLVDNGIDINTPNYKKYTPLYLAAQNNNFETANILMEFGSVIDHTYSSRVV